MICSKFRQSKHASFLCGTTTGSAGRASGFRTGVEVVDLTVHGGPYPASTNFGATSVGTMSIRRFLWPFSYRNIPADLLPAELA